MSQIILDKVMTRRVGQLYSTKVLLLYFIKLHKCQIDENVVIKLK